MLRTHTCGELRAEQAGSQATLCGWVQKVRDKGGMVWIDLRDRYGVTQLIFEEGVTDTKVIEMAKTIGREFVLKASGEVVERFAKNDKIETGDIEIKVTDLEILNASKVPPFIIDNDTDGGEELRMKYRYLDLRRGEVRDKLMLRHKMLQATRKYLSDSSFMEVETPVLIKSTPEGARDFVVPSRVNKGEFYALPQSPQTFKQLLMVSGFDRYFQIVKCFRDEDLRADRQPEFTQIDCEMSFVSQQDILDTFEGLTRFLFKEALDVEVGEFVHMQYDDAMRLYGSDKPDVRFGMQFVELNDVAQNKGFNVFDQAELVVGICAEGCADWTRKQIDALTDFVKRPQVGAKGLVHVKCNTDGTFKSSVDKFYSQEDLKAWADKAGAKPGDLILVLSGGIDATRKQMNDLRLHMGDLLELKDPMNFKPLWVLDFPLLEWDEDTQRYHAMHHPFTSPKEEQIPLLDTDPGAVKANAYDLVINGVEIGGGSIRIHDQKTQALMFKHLGFSDEEAKSQFGFLMEAFEYGAPPHGGIAFGFDRLCSMFGGSDSIRDFIAFPKNTSARDVMIESPSPISRDQLDDLGLDLLPSE
ncbi:aspartate--tRNA ligase [Reichenbachiella agariperforans]|uniref:Aspartate--tRNA ligase n=1 Tax=Reichenbachiella agariperforans TaxID=156994 RepID=A0A1M6LTD1_REIAG|nr:aspartate--tRNA ligase [Reichenbachiella agariperforans]MBU2914044.1 aspartate--tRNA ligase [Reichenbachiella agariperforans]SHJ74463.1 aspartyl-tRNA synthetase [Reichenbachiella agariperforans]